MVRPALWRPSPSLPLLSSVTTFTPSPSHGLLTTQLVSSSTRLFTRSVGCTCKTLLHYRHEAERKLNSDQEHSESYSSKGDEVEGPGPLLSSLQLWLPHLPPPSKPSLPSFSALTSSRRRSPSSPTGVRLLPSSSLRNQLQLVAQATIMQLSSPCRSGQKVQRREATS